jgi:hypothetical protein
LTRVFLFFGKILGCFVTFSPKTLKNRRIFSRKRRIDPQTSLDTSLALTQGSLQAAVTHGGHLYATEMVGVVRVRSCSLGETSFMYKNFLPRFTRFYYDFPGFYQFLVKKRHKILPNFFYIKLIFPSYFFMLIK